MEVKDFGFALRCFSCQSLVDLLTILRENMTVGHNRMAKDILRHGLGLSGPAAKQVLPLFKLAVYKYPFDEFPALELFLYGQIQPTQFKETVEEIFRNLPSSRSEIKEVASETVSLSPALKKWLIQFITKFEESQSQKLPRRRPIHIPVQPQKPTLENLWDLLEMSENTDPTQLVSYLQPFVPTIESNLSGVKESVIRKTLECVIEMARLLREKLTAVKSDGFLKNITPLLRRYSVPVSQAALACLPLLIAYLSKSSILASLIIEMLMDKKRIQPSLKKILLEAVEKFINNGAVSGQNEKFSIGQIVIKIYGEKAENEAAKRLLDLLDERFPYEYKQTLQKLAAEFPTSDSISGRRRRVLLSRRRAVSEGTRKENEARPEPYSKDLRNRRVTFNIKNYY